MIVSPHTHCESSLTASTLKTLVKQAKTLGRKYFVCTDLGHLSSILKAYGAAKKEGLKFIPGIEFYFKDPQCPFVVGTTVDRCRYFTATLYCKSQTAYQELCKLVSKTTFPTVEVYEEKRQLWSWEDIKFMSQFETDLVLGGIHCVVGKPMLANKADVGQNIFLKLKELFGDRLYTSIICEPWSKKWNTVAEIKYTDETRDALLSSDYVGTDRERKIKVKELIAHPSRHLAIKNKCVGGMFSEVGKSIHSVKEHKGFLPLPGGDAQLKINRFLYALSKKHGVKILVSDYAYYAQKEDKMVQTMILDGTDKLQPNFHMKNDEEVSNYLSTVMGFSQAQVNELIFNNENWAKQYDNFTIKYEWRLAESETGSVQKMMEIIKKNGRMRWNDPVWCARLKEEIEVIVKNPKKNLLPYFFPIVDILNYYKENGYLTGPGRGSAGGSLLAYLLDITHVNPIKYKLSFSRFFSLDRIMNNKLPDIDTDLEGRELLVGEDGKSGYLYGRWGDKAAQISTRTTIRLKSAIKDTNRYLKGKVEPEIEVFSKGLPQPPQGVPDIAYVFGFESEEGDHIPGLIEQNEELQKYAKERPEEWEIVRKSLGITRAYSKHASAFVLSDIPIKDIVPTKDGNITQYEAKECEEAGLIKYDLLVINQLKDIRVCINLINKKNNEQNFVGEFTHNGQRLYVWDLPEDKDVFKSVWGGNTETCFQINTRSMVPFVKDILPQSIEDLAVILALVRPGPLDFVDTNTGRNMAEEYVLRRRGEGAEDLPILKTLLPETYSVIVYQEQLVRIAKELGGFDGAEAEKFRENAAKKKKVELMKQKGLFIEGAVKKIAKDEAEMLWERMETFARYSFNLAHATEYAMITYACMFLKYYYPLEWWAAILTNADESEITGVLWPFVKDVVLPPDINLSSDIMAVDYTNGKIRSKLSVIRGMGDKTLDPIVSNRPYKDIQDFVDKEVAGPSLSHKLTHVGVLDSLYPPHTNLLEKLKLYQDAVEIKKFREKIEDANAKGKKCRLLAPKPGVIPEEYLNLKPMQEAAMKKSVLPSLPIDLFDLGAKYSSVRDTFGNGIAVMSKNNHSTPLFTGEKLKRLDEIDGDSINKDIYVAATCFVVEAKEFSYAKNKKKALKLIVDADGYVSEKVLWPGYESNELIYPKELKKGSIITLFLKKREGKKDMNVMDIVVET